jgi:Zn-dependent protease
MLLGASPGVLIALVLIILVCFPVHEFSHALAAYRLGDGTAKMMGRLTLNPIAHFDPIGALLLVVAGFGWAKPTPVNPYNLRGGRYAEGIVAAAGPISNLVLASAAALPLRYITMTEMSVPSVFAQTLYYFVVFNVILFVFNLIPIPPLDGSKVLFSLLNPRTVWQIRPPLERYGFLLLVVAAFVPIGPGGTLVGIVFDSIAQPLVNLLTGF